MDAFSQGDVIDVSEFYDEDDASGDGGVEDAFAEYHKQVCVLRLITSRPCLIFVFP